jgi:AcrR family transcriptional regulator
LAAPTAEKDILRKLKPGPGLSREAVATDQTLRLRLALSSLAAESGFDAVTVRSLIRRAGISTSTFYNHYDSIEGCLADIVGTTIRSVGSDLTETRESGLDAIGGMRRALRLWMRRLAGEPAITDVVFIESFAAGSRVREEMDQALHEVESLFCQTFDTAPRPVAGTTHLAVGLLAGLLGIVRETALAGRAAELPQLTDELVDWMLSVAHEEVVTFRSPRSRPAGDPPALRLPWVGAEPALRESIADPGHRAIMTTARLAASGGLSGLTSSKIRRDAGLSRREFERHFTGVEECFLDAVESIATMAAQVACMSAADAESWERRIYRTIGMLCSLAAGDKNLARLVLVDITAAGRTGLIRREALIDRAAAYVCAQAPPGRRPSTVAASASVSAIWRIAETEVAAGRADQLPRVAPVFVYMILASRRRRERES